KWFFGLESFLRQHYTSSRESAAILAAYLKGQEKLSADPSRGHAARQISQAKPSEPAPRDFRADIPRPPTDIPDVNRQAVGAGLPAGGQCEFSIGPDQFLIGFSKNLATPDLAPDIIWPDVITPPREGWDELSAYRVLACRLDRLFIGGGVFFWRRRGRRRW